MIYLVDERILKRKIIQINESLQMITKYINISYKEFENDKVIQNVVEFNLFIIINQMAEIANHIIVDNDYGIIETLSDGFRVLKQKGYISESNMNNYIKMVGFRNIIAHQYVDLKKEIVFDVIKNKLKDIVEFVNMIDKEFID